MLLYGVAYKVQCSCVLWSALRLPATNLKGKTRALVDDESTNTLGPLFQMTADKNTHKYISSDGTWGPTMYRSKTEIQLQMIHGMHKFPLLSARKRLATSEIKLD